MRLSIIVRTGVFLAGLVGVAGCSLAADPANTVQETDSVQRSEPVADGLSGQVQEAPGVRRSWYQPPPEDQHPYVPPPKKRYIPLGGDSTGPVIILPGGNGPQSD